MSEALTPSDFERLGEDKIREVINRFLDSVFDDFMIGYLFRGKPHARIRELEARFAMSHLGGPSLYQGRTMREAHEPLRIFSGQFDRRRQLLKQAFHSCQIPEDITERWLAHQEALRGHIVVKAC